jgi:hypothetical protein
LEIRLKIAVTMVAMHGHDVTNFDKINYRLPHMGKERLERINQLPVMLEVAQEAEDWDEAAEEAEDGDEAVN